MSLIVYLDQNQWIALARAAMRPQQHSELVGLLRRLAEAVLSGAIRMPLTMANLYETYKIGDPRRRAELAEVQALLSDGWVFHARSLRLRCEARRLFRASAGLAEEPLERDWFLSDVFIDAFAETTDARLEERVPAGLAAAIRARPVEALMSWWMSADGPERGAGVAAFSASSEDLRAAIESRRTLVADQPQSIRRRAYGARLIIDEMDALLEIGQRAGLPWRTITDMGPKLMRELVREVPTYNAERELTIRLEAQPRGITENDIRDMATYTAVLPYADIVVGENQFINLARQAGLHVQYGTRITKDLAQLGAWLL